jgi:hypothetical protein
MIDRQTDNRQMMDRQIDRQTERQRDRGQKGAIPVFTWVTSNTPTIRDKLMRKKQKHFI